MAVAIITSFVQQCDSNGVPLSSGTIDVYSAGTTTPLSLYSDTGLSVSATNPITLDSSGRHAITYIATASYKIVVKNASGTTIYTRDNIDPGVAIGSGALAVANGGTAATTAAAARTNLGAASATDMATAQSDISTLNTWTGNGLTTRTRIASGTTAQQPSAGTVGLRYNSTTGFFEADNGSNWKNLLRQGQALPADFATGSAVICLKRSRNTTLAATSTSSSIPLDSSIPQISEGTEIFTTAFTPSSASSIIRVRAKIEHQVSAGSVAVFALFKNTDADAVQSAVCQYNNAGDGGQAIIEYEVSLASTSAVTYSIRAGTNATLYFNTNASGHTLGGTRQSFLLIEEWLSP